MSHAEIEFLEDEYVELNDTTGWDCRRRSDGTCEADGTCPSCGGTAYGPRISVLRRTPVATRDLTVRGEDCDVPCECRCGHDHGGGREKGCGRWWIVRCHGLQDKSQ